LASHEAPRPVVIGISGASGAIIARAAVELLLERGYPVALTYTPAAAAVWQQEMDEALPTVVAAWQERGLVSYDVRDFAAPIASGTYPTSGMVVMPCSMSTVSAIAHGSSTNLLQRAADVTLKERRPLVVVPRETPLSAIHLENLLALARLGVVVLPAMPAFYLRPGRIEDIALFLACRALDALGIPDALRPGLRYSGSPDVDSRHR
jgi:4-hydroxy-3-polyprenylbenzoate decarboxylase